MNTQTVLQWKYTACQYNIENINGFKTYSMSEGLTQDDKDELVRYGGAYKRPTSLPDRPTEDELTLFPVTLASILLRSGKRAVIRTCYVGQDYAGVRWGNFFSHALVLPEGNWDFYPIQLADSPLFQNGLTMEEREIGHRPDPLPALQIDDDSLHDWTDELDNFFMNEERRDILRNLLASVRATKKSGRNVYLRDTRDNIPLWIAAVQYAFPVRWAQEMMFSTYASSAASARLVQLAASIPDDADSFASQSFRVFDIAEGRIPPAIPDRWAEQIHFDDGAYPGKELEARKSEMVRWTASIYDGSPESIFEMIAFLQDRRETPKVDELKVMKVDEPIPPALAGILESLRTRPLDNRILALQLIAADPPRVFSKLSVLNAVLSIFLDTALESGDKGTMQIFSRFFMRQFLVESGKMDAIRAGQFEVLKRLFADSPKRAEFGRGLLDRLSGYGRTDTQFLELALILLLVKNTKVEELDRFYVSMTNLCPNDVADRFIHAMLPAMVSCADTPAMHDCLVKMAADQAKKKSRGAKNNDDNDEVPDYGTDIYTVEFCKTYISALLNCGADKWNPGDPLTTQMAAFLQYLLNTASRSVYDGFTQLARRGGRLQKVILRLFGVDDYLLKTFGATIYKTVVKEIPNLSKDGEKNLRDILSIRSFSTVMLENISGMFGRLLDSFKSFMVFWLLGLFAVLLVGVVAAVWLLPGAPGSSKLPAEKAPAAATSQAAAKGKPHEPAKQVKEPEKDVARDTADKPREAGGR